MAHVTILQAVPRLETGGSEQAAVEIAAALGAAGARALVATEGGRMATALAEAGGEMVPLPMASKSPFTMLANARRLVELIEARKVDLVHARYLAAETETNPAARAYLESDDVALRFMPSAAVTWDERGSSASRVVRERGWALPLESTDPRV